LTHGDQF